MAPEITWRPGRPGVERKVAYQHKLADDPSWTIIALEVLLPPDASTPPHRHGRANVFAYVLEGEVLSAMNDGDAKVYKPGESWYEPPGCRHRVSDNNSKTESAKFLATFLIRTELLEKEGRGILVQIEPEYLAQMQ